MQRIGRAWRFGQKSSEVLIVDLALDTHSKESEFSMYCEYLEKILNVSLHGLTPHNYAGYVLYESSGSTLSRLFELSGFEVDPEEVFDSIYEKRVEELRGKLERLIELREKVRKAKPVETVKRDLKLKLGYPPSRQPKTGSNYVAAEVAFTINGGNLFNERILVEIPQGKARLRGVRVYRLLEYESADIEEVEGDVSSTEKIEVESAIARGFTEPLRIYARNLGSEASALILTLKPVFVKSLRRFDMFEMAVREELRRSKRRIDVEMKAVEHIKKYLEEQGYIIIEDYYSGPRPFDIVVEKNGKLYTAECKGRFLRKGEQPSIVLTANEMNWGLNYRDRHLMCIAILNKKNVNVETYTFEEFLEKWNIRKKRSYYDYVIEAEKKTAL